MNNPAPPPPPLTGRDILYVSSLDWDDHWQGHHEIALALARAGNRVLFVENTGVRAPRLRDAARLGRRTRNFLHGSRGVRQVAPGLWALAPMVLPFPYGRLARALNHRLLVAALERWMKTVGFAPEVVWTYLPTPLVHDLLDHFRPRVSVYYCIDDFASSSAAAARIGDSEAAMFRRVDLLFVTAEKLRARVAAAGRSAEVFPFAVDFGPFERARLGAAEVPAEIRALGRPVVGYIGALHRWLDQDLLAAVARLLPEVKFVLIGPDQRDDQRVDGEPNVHLLGLRAHEELPACLRGFDVGLIPYRRCDYTDAVYPTKLNEYLAMGLPVVSTALPEILRFNAAHGDLVATASDAPTFAAAIRAAIAGGSPEARERRIAVARTNSWERRIPEMAARIAARLGSERDARAAEVGVLLARALAGSWRARVEPVSAEDRAALERAAPVIIAGGAAGLVQRRLGAGNEDTPFRDVFRLQVLDELQRAQGLERLLGALAGRGIAPVLIKGWALARHYPARGLRPYTDFDLVVRPEELGAACAALVEIGVAAVDLPEGVARPEALGGLRARPDAKPKAGEIYVDLHLGHHRLVDRDPAERARRLERARVGAVDVLLLSPEDHLRTVALHLFEHATWRSLCLVDVAVLAETFGASLDWEYLLRGDARRSEAVVVALRLAEALLGARLDSPLVGGRAPLPRWIAEALLRAWGAPFDRPSLFERVPRRPAALFEAARRRWPNPLVATFAVGGRFNALPRWPYQLADFLGRGGRYAMRRLTQRRS